MPSPFPGMDPYLEEATGWGGVHLTLIVAIQAQLNRILPPGFVAKIDEYVWVRDTEDDEATPKLRKPDAFLPEPRKSKGDVAIASRSLTAPSVRGKLPANRKRKSRVLHIATAGGERVVTTLEVLSPSNKAPGDGRDAYVQKRREYLATVNFVEIDLLRNGNRFPMGRPAPPSSDYYVFSCRKDDYPETDVWAFTVRDELPTIPIPIAPGIEYVPLDLREALDRIYREGGYEGRIDYAVPPDPPLARDRAEWAVKLLQG